MAKILVVDDSEFMRELVKKTLSNGGFKDIVEASNGDDAIAQFTKTKPNLVLLDIILGPPKTGLDVLKAIRAKDAKAKVIMVTVVDQPKVTQEAKKIGAKAFVNKPINPNKLLAEVKKALQ
jgi:two-component system, chemotaxis family, chemotaxis protein CheY